MDSENIIETCLKTVFQVLTNTLWYITNQQMVINERSKKETLMILPVPPTFERFQGYNEHRRKKQKNPPSSETSTSKSF